MVSAEGGMVNGEGKHYILFLNHTSDLMQYITVTSTLITKKKCRSGPKPLPTEAMHKIPPWNQSGNVIYLNLIQGLLKRTRGFKIFLKIHSYGFTEVSKRKKKPNNSNS